MRAFLRLLAKAFAKLAEFLQALSGIGAGMILLAFLACAAPRVEYVRVEVPVPVPCPPPPTAALIEPDLPIYHLANKPEDLAFLGRWEAEVTAAFRDSTVLLLRELRYRIAILKGYLPSGGKP